MISALTGVVVCKLFALSPHFEAVRWLGGSLSCACATALMALTGTVHPPAGATALMAVVEPSVAGLGWFLLVPVMLGCALMLAVALLVNNIQRRFPFYWWTPGETGAYWRGSKEAEAEKEKKQAGEEEEEEEDNDDEERQRHRDEESNGSGSSGDLTQTVSRIVSVLSGREGEIVIHGGA
ncbi:hypothetical protein VTH06DRAFT_4725 [Thermothelomyces fergusii]